MYFVFNLIYFRSKGSFISALRVVLVAKLVISGILFSIFFVLALYTFFLITSFLATSLSLLKSKGTRANLSASILSTLDLELPKSTPLTSFHLSTPFSFFKSAFAA